MFNKSEIMRLAWVWAKQDLWAARLPASQLRRLFRAALVRAWADAKRMAAYRAAQHATFATIRPAAEIRDAIMVLECKDRLHGSDWARLDALRAELNCTDFQITT